MSARLFVGNLPFDSTEEELRELFAPLGPVLRIHFPLDRETSRPRGFAFVEFDDSAKALEAITRFNNQLFRGRPLVVQSAGRIRRLPFGGRAFARNRSWPVVGTRRGRGGEEAFTQFRARRSASRQKEIPQGRPWRAWAEGAD